MALGVRQLFAYRDTFRSFREGEVLAGSLTTPGSYSPVVTSAPCRFVSKRYDENPSPAGRIDFAHFEVLNRMECETTLDIRPGDKIVDASNGAVYTVNAQTANRPTRGARNTNYQVADLLPERNPPAGVS